MKRNPKPNDVLRQAREERGWTQRRLADELSVDVQTVSSWERGIRSPLLEFRHQLCTLFSKTPEQPDFSPQFSIEQREEKVD